MLMTEELIERFIEHGDQKHEADPILVCRFSNLVTQDRWYPISYNPDDGTCYGYIEEGNGATRWDTFKIEDLEAMVNWEGSPRVTRDDSFNETPLSMLYPDHWNSVEQFLSKEDQKKIDEKKAQEEVQKENKELFDRPVEQDNDMELSL